MFEIYGLRIRISRGDTGGLTIRAKSKTAFEDADRAVVTVRRRGGEEIYSQTSKVTADGKASFLFDDAETKNWKPGLYEWDVRYVLGAELGDRQEVTGGREVITPMRPAAFEVVKAVGEL